MYYEMRMAKLLQKDFHKVEFLENYLNCMPLFNLNSHTRTIICNHIYQSPVMLITQFDQS